ncbi:MAG TPA: MFS transporter, partial [Isosphaeraceae bacterium]|nr:MFS transporter [Isosphaeraceae bacterium]
MNAGVRWRLAAMMALVYAVQGAFWPLLTVHLKDLGIDGRGRGWIFATMAIASLATPLGAGQLADRRMATQRLLAILYALGTGLLVCFALGASTHTLPLFLLFLVFWMVVAPTYGLSTSLALRNLEHPHEQFGGVRLWGTVGWMLVGWMVSLVMAFSGSTRAGQGAYEAFAVAAALSAILAVYCLSLPHTPPLASDSEPTRMKLDPQAVLALVRQPVVGRYLLVAFGVSLTMPYVYQVIPAYLEARGLSRPWIASAMTLGQVLEIFALAALPWMLRRFSYQGTLALGIAAWALRFGSLLFDPPLWVCVAGILLHGVGIACFTVGGQVFLDSQAPVDRRASAQALNVVVTSGIGLLLGSLLAGEIVGRLSTGSALVFLVPCLINAGLLGYFVQGFRPKASTTGRERVPTSVRSSVREVAREAVVCGGNVGAES